MRNRTYRYFEGEALYPFGHGLSYTQFEYSGLEIERSGDSITATVNVKNVGKRAGDEIAQLYVREVSPPEPRALKQLRGIQKLTLKPGESRQATFRLSPGKDFTHYDVARKRYAVDAGTYELQVGASSADIRARANLTIDVAG
jgi:beta-glucosidase